MLIRILGSAAGGGVPQWNCRCSNCVAARAGSPDIRPRTQSSVAVSADGRAWFLLNVSPDVRQQILSFPALGPGRNLVSSRNQVSERSTAIAGCVLTDAELDHTAGLLLLREGGTFGIHCTATVRRWLNRYLPVEPILSCFSPAGINPAARWCELPFDAAIELHLPDGSPSGLRVRAFEVDGHVPRYVKEEAASAVGSVIGLQIEDTNTGGRLVYAPCVGSPGRVLRNAASEADCLVIDGTFWDDEEPIRCGIGSRTARAMGHLPVSGPDGSLNWLGELDVRHRVYIHINNTNPMLNERGPEYRLVTGRGVCVGADGDSFEL
ncbi:MAG TPA: pyrroloquinoline quinone biosynthesis protein PqqB [Gemmataceae bacterium]|nr:pyrroloquinoline quinone biosynthesis protein PqqB [Gemmataceae bacterium]